MRGVQDMLKKFLIPQRITLIIFCLGLIGLVFSLGDLTAVGYEVSKTVWLKWWVRLLVLGLWGVILFSKGLFPKNNPNLRPFSKKTWFYLGLLIAVTALAAGLGVNWQQSLWGNYYRGDGLVTWWHLLVLGIVARWVVVPQQFKQILPMSFAVSWLLIVSSSWWSQLASWLPVGFGNPNIAGGFIVVITPLVVFFAQKYHWSSGLAVYLISVMTTIYLEVWGAAISLVLGLVMYGFLRRAKLRKLVVLIPIVALVIGTIGIMWWQPVGNSRFTQSRMRIFHKLGQAVLKRPLLGWGWANVDTAFISTNWPVPINDDVYVDKAHTQLLEMTVTSGLLGLGVYLLLIGYIYRQVGNSIAINQSWTQMLFLTFLLYLFHSQTNVTSVAQDAIFWLSAGLLLDCS